MKKTIVVVGSGPGISNAVAEKFGSAGFSVALVARSEDKLASSVAALKAKGIEAASFRADASDPASIRSAISKVRAFGDMHAIHWNAYGGSRAGDLLAADPKELLAAFSVAVVGLVSAVQEALPDLKKNKGAVLVTNGAFGEISPQVDAYAVSAKFMDLALGNAAKHKLVGLLSERLKGDGIFVAEVMVAGSVKGTAWDQGSANLEASRIANEFWRLYESRTDIRARVS